MKVEGMLSENEQELLYNLARESKGDIIEIGAYKGLSTTIFASTTKNKVYSIDPHTDKAVLKVYKKNIRPYNNIVHIKKTSNKAWRDMFDMLDIFNIGLLFIDGDHSYEQCRRDYYQYVQFVRYDLGTIVIHDVVPIGNLTGVYKFVYEFLTKSIRFGNPKLTDCTLSFKRVNENTIKDRVQGYIIIMKILLYATAHKIKVPGWIRKIGTKIFNG